MKKRRVSFKLDTDEAAVVAPLDFWEQLQIHFEESAKEFPEHEEGWMDAHSLVEKWVERTRDKRKAVNS